MTILEKTLALLEVEIFSKAPTEAISFAAAIAEEVNFDSGEELFKENDHADSLILVLSGSVRLTRSGESIATLGPGDVMGAWSLLDVDNRVTTAIAAETVQTLVIEREPFLDLIADHPAISQSILQSLAQRLRTLIPALTNDPNPGGRVNAG